MNKITYIIIAMVLGIMFSCENKWDEHYFKSTATGSTFDGNMLEYVKSNPSFSKFYDILVETGLDAELGKNQIMTLWLPNNDAIDELNLTNEEMVKLVMYHINITAIYDDQFENIINDPSLRARIKTLNDKYITLGGNTSSYIVNDANVTKTNTITKNGVVHEIDKLLSTRLNAYEYIQTLGEEYSYLKNFLNSFDYRVFDKEASTPVGFDELGQVVYDSVWVNQNSFFDENGDLRLEDPLYTVFVSSNQVIDDAVNDLATSIINLGSVIDTAKAYDWCFENFFTGVYMPTYPADELIRLTTFDYWYTLKQEVSLETTALSNGVLYEVSKLHIPRYTALSPFTINFFDNWKQIKGKATKVTGGKEIYWPTANDPAVYFNASLKYSGADPLDLAHSKAGKVLRYRSAQNQVVGQDFYYEFKTAKINNDKSLTEYRVAPGEYDITVMQREKYSTPNIKFSLTTPDRTNTLVLNESYNVRLSSTDRTTEGFVGSVNFGDPENTVFTEGTNILKVQALGAPYNLMLRSITFSPKLSISNY